METLHEALAAAGAADIETSECMDGSVVLRFRGLLDYGIFRRWLVDHDGALSVDHHNVVRITAMTEAAATTHEPLGQGCTVDAGAIRQQSYTAVAVPAAALDGLLREPSVLKVRVGLAGLVVDRLQPSVIKDGLAHLKRKGRIAAAATKRKWPATSRTQRRAAARRARSAGWLAGWL